MTPVTLTTHGLAACDQFAAWHEWYAPYLPYRCARAAQPGFRRDGDGLDGERLRAEPRRLPSCRSPPRRRPGPPQSGGPLVHRPQQGKPNPLQDPGSRGVGTGQGALRVFAGRRDVERAVGDALATHLARDSFQPIAPALDAAGCRRFDCRVAAGCRISSSCWSATCRSCRWSTDQGWRRPFRQWSRACLAPSAGAMAEARRPIDATLMERVRRAVRKNLRSRSLGPDTLCREAATSRLAALPPARARRWRGALHPA